LVRVGLFNTIFNNISVILLVWFIGGGKQEYLERKLTDLPEVTYKVYHKVVWCTSHHSHDLNLVIYLTGCHMYMYISQAVICTCISHRLSYVHVHLTGCHMYISQAVICTCISHRLSYVHLYLTGCHMYMYISQAVICTCISSYHRMPAMTNFISFVMRQVISTKRSRVSVISLSWYVCWWTISPQGQHLLRSIFI
jgi:hypothetical protein